MSLGKTFEIALADGKVTTNPAASSSSELKTMRASGFLSVEEEKLTAAMP
jgi:hypothetical protein